MPIGPGGLAAIDSATKVGQGIMDQIFAKRNVRLQTQANQKLAAYTNQMNIENWKRENQYNTPAAQMQRYKEAGLNPNLIYGQGTPGNAGSIPNYQQPVTDVSLPLPQPLAQAGNVISNYQDMKLKQANTDNVKQMTQNAVTKNAQDILNLQFDKQFEWQRRLFENRNLGQQYDIGSQRLNIGAEDLKQQIMKTNQTELLMPYHNIALQAEYAVKARGMEKFNMDLALLNQEKELNKARIDLMESEKAVKDAGLPILEWDKALKQQEWIRGRKLMPWEVQTAERNYKWLPWKNAASVAGAAVGAGVGAGVAVSKAWRGGKPMPGGTTVGPYTYMPGK